MKIWPSSHAVTPFAGIGSEVYVPVEQKRIGWGIELKREYFQQACQNARISVEKHHMQRSLL